MVRPDNLSPVPVLDSISEILDIVEGLDRTLDLIDWLETFELLIDTADPEC